MPVTYKKIASVTVGAGGAASMEFTSIPGTYTDLVILYSARTNRASEVVDNINISFNSSTSNFTSRYLVGTGTIVVSSTSLNRFGGFATGASATASTFGNSLVYIPNYASATNKSFSVDAVSETNGTTSYQIFSAGLWSQTSAITTITFTSNTSDSFVQYSTAVLYGISKS
jgi:hypothetical protein